MLGDFLRTVLSAALVLGVLVFIHELGHYLAARWRGVHVEVFSIGFGKPLLRWRDRVGTEWRICILPIGGYVKPHGFEGPEEASPEIRANWLPGRTFHDKPVLSRAIVIVAGPVFNFLLAIVLFAVVFAFNGRPPDASDLAGLRPSVGGVVAGSSADKAGLKPGDLIEQVDGVSIPNFANLQRLVAASPGRQVQLTVRRAGHDITLPATLGSVTDGGRAEGQLGVQADLPPPQHVSPGGAVVAAVRTTGVVIVGWVAGFWQLITGHVSPSHLGGTLRIAQMSGQFAAAGVTSLLTFMAILSINLGMVNLLPVPVLDGGRLVFYAIEALRGRPVSRGVQEYGFRAGFMLIAGIFLFATFNDLTQFGLFDWLRHVIG
ncbi:RIP metalloprotease RseP [Lichenicola sp.]|uniref:RIP metalloprotease RseP n=1 Tax=Lichenicola sp. TaxID=2804529 RepID=UPI003AFFF25D